MQSQNHLKVLDTNHHLSPLLVPFPRIRGLFWLTRALPLSYLETIASSLQVGFDFDQEVFKLATRVLLLKLS